jgi:nicotinate dehydrogenase subunit A
MTTTTVVINGRPTLLAAIGERSLLDVLRNDLGLTAARFGCGEEQCGACVVLVDGQPVYSCTRPADSLGGRSVTTLEGLMVDGHPHPLQQAFIDEQAGQCGYCLSGIVLSAKALLDRNPRPTRADVIAALEPHLCRCGAHSRIIRAVERAAAVLAEAAQ